jgi:tetratricopeptide (TPR) repeat protein
MDMVRWLVLLVVGALASLWTLSSRAEEAVLGQLYGSGVHAYFSGDYLKAYQKLTAAINTGSRDPRVFYFRGLVYLHLGRSPEAQMDFQKGAELESKDVNKYYDVARALERVQGAERLELEAYRVRARVAALEEAERLRKARYEAIQREEARVLQRQAEEGAAPTEEAPETVPTPSGEAAGTEHNPNANPDPFSTSKEEAKPAGAEGQPGAEAAEKTATDNKTAAPEEKSTSTNPVEEQKPAAETKPAVEDPFASKPAAKDKSAGKKSILGALGKAISKGAAGGGSADKPSE